MTYGLPIFAQVLGAVLIGAGTWLIVSFSGGWAFLEIPWLSGIVLWFLFEFIEGHTVTRVYFMRLRRMTQEPLRAGKFIPELEKARAQTVPTFTHFLDLPLLVIIIALGAIKPDSWSVFFVGCVMSLLISTALTVFAPKFYPWRPQNS
jgi:hypothetical protein